jgi:hypothetical protein
METNEIELRRRSGSQRSLSVQRHVADRHRDASKCRCGRGKERED